MARKFQYDTVPPVRTAEGLIKGYQLDQVFIFKGIPYAYADRFQQPVPVTPWEGVKEATSYGFVCPLLNQETPNGELMAPHRYWPMDEHCQNLNIWTKALDENAKRPVMVWLHGGGYTAGSSIEQAAYDGYNLCDLGDMVIVSVNHRLNILGYLDLSSYGEKYANSANAGHADLVAALEWIHRNIAAFGGDPENVTIFGQSGGGMKVADLMQIPAADGLFARGYIMSGVMKPGIMMTEGGTGHEIVEALLQELGIAADEIEKLETVPYYDLARAYQKVSVPLAMQGIYIGGGPKKNEFYCGEPLRFGFREHAFTIPLLIGSVFGEFAFTPAAFDKTTLAGEEILPIVQKAYGSHAEEMLEAFRCAYPDKNPVDVICIDRAMRGATKELANLHARGGKAPTYLYNFTLEYPFQHGKCAWHCSDIPFVFHNTSLVEICNIPGVSDELEQQIFEAVSSFAATGTPTGSHLPKWPPVTPEAEPTMILDRTCEVRTNYDDALIRCIEEKLPPFSLFELADQDVQH